TRKARTIMAKKSSIPPAPPIRDLKKEWVDRIAAKLIGRKITAVRYMTKEECQGFDWYDSAVVLVLDNGVELIPSQDDEGNGPGAIFTNIKGLTIIPVI